MATLLANYCPEVFQKVPYFDTAVEKMHALDLDYVLAEIGQVFVKHNVCEKYGIMVIHRHFDLQPNEILVDSTNADGSLSVAVPWVINGTMVENPVDSAFWHSFEMPREKFIRAQTWSFGDEGKLQPFEFEFDNNGDLDEPPKEFVNELYVKLREFNVEDVFGFSLHHENNWETPILEKRANIHRYDKYDAPPLEEIGREVVYWTFAVDGHFCGGHGLQNLVPVKGSCISGAAKGSCVSGAAKGSCVSGAAKGSCVSGAAKGSCVSGAAKGSCDSGAAKGSCDSGAAKGSCVSGAAKGSCVSGAAKGSCVSGAAKGSCVSGAAKGSCVSGTPKGSVSVAIRPWW